MYTRIRIIFTILSVICVAALFPLGAFLGWTAFLIDLIVAALLFLPVFYCKRKQDLIDNPPEQQPDYLHPQPVAADKPTESDEETKE